MTILVNKTNDDQPYVQSHSHGGTDRVYVGENDFNAAPRSAIVDLSQDASTAASFLFDHVEARATVGQDGPPIRPAIHRDGTIYVAYFGWRGTGGGTFTSDIVVARDDHWAAGATRFTDLIDTDSLPGVRIANCG